MNKQKVKTVKNKIKIDDDVYKMLVEIKGKEISLQWAVNEIVRQYLDQIKESVGLVLKIGDRVK